MHEYWTQKSKNSCNNLSEKSCYDWYVSIQFVFFSLSLIIFIIFKFKFSYFFFLHEIGFFFVKWLSSLYLFKICISSSLCSFIFRKTDESCAKKWWNQSKCERLKLIIWTRKNFVSNFVDNALFLLIFFTWFGKKQKESFWWFNFLCFICFCLHATIFKF